MNKFKVGDRVAYTNASGFRTVPTDTRGSITAIYNLNREPGYYVAFDDRHGYADRNGNFAVLEENLKAVETPIAWVYPKVGDRVRLHPSGGAFDSQAAIYGTIVDKQGAQAEEEVFYKVQLERSGKDRALTSDSFEVVHYALA